MALVIQFMMYFLRPEQSQAPHPQTNVAEETVQRMMNHRGQNKEAN